MRRDNRKRNREEKIKRQEKMKGEEAITDKRKWREKGETERRNSDRKEKRK